MRFVIAVLFTALAVSSAPAQLQQPRSQSKPATQQQAKPADPEQQKLSEQEEALRQRWLLKEKFNKGWDVTSENEHDKRWIASRCKTEARKQIPEAQRVRPRTALRAALELALRDYFRSIIAP
jgi:hypothetical protein